MELEHARNSLNRHSGDRRLKDELVVDESLRSADESAPVELDLARQNEKLISRHDLSSEGDVITSGESRKSSRSTEAGMRDTAELCTCLDHQDSREDRTPWNVAIDPEFIVANLANSKDGSSRFGNPQDPIHHSHMATLGEKTINLLLAKNRLGSVDLVDWKK